MGIWFFAPNKITKVSPANSHSYLFVRDSHGPNLSPYYSFLTTIRASMEAHAFCRNSKQAYFISATYSHFTKKSLQGDLDIRRWHK